jgi:hypothetical protein
MTGARLPAGSAEVACYTRGFPDPPCTLSGAAIAGPRPKHEGGGRGRGNLSR